MSALLLACSIENPLGTVTDPAASDTDPGTTDADTDTTAEEPTTGAPASACGDGVVAWQHDEGGEGSNVSAHAVAVDGAGRIVVLAAAEFEPMVLVLDPEGTEVWRTKLSGEPVDIRDLVVDEAGRIFVGGEEWATGQSTAAMLRAFSPDGEELWSFSEPGPAPADAAAIAGLALGQGALFSAGTTGTGALVVRRHDPATGEAAWETNHSESIEQVSEPAIAVVGDRLLVVARAMLSEQIYYRPLVLQLDGDGVIESVAVDDQIVGFWRDVEPIGAGEWILAGELLGDLDVTESVAIKRAGPDGEAWSTVFAGNDILEYVSDVAVAPDERVLVVGKTGTDDFLKEIPSVRCMNGDGGGLWQETFEFNDNAQFQTESANGGAFGPGFMVVVGDTRSGPHSEMWVRKYTLDCSTSSSVSRTRIRAHQRTRFKRP
ncbi:PQQ-binding-like beta-propeller repeat protein [Nannocystis sp. ncelm1]|uniref:PQQ-binding-like beta-propeller repeat protein n=1 Tax=Nannocystis radixulma TaxID=2995305 RepID=A0ABT5BEE8_9BACT|nr:PQQ-binding-like beta-propeller repeat protein [Nannocystis radixulma]